MVPMHTPPWQASSLVQALPSSQVVPSRTVVPMHTPLWQVSPLVQALSSSHAAPSSSAALPTQVPFWQVSAAVQALPSSHAAPVLGVTVQLAVPLQVRVLHWSEVQVIAVPTHWPPPVQVSLNVQALPSSHAAPVLGVTVQLDVPLQVRVLHWSEVQVIAVPTHWPLPSQVSLKEQASPSSQLVPVSGVTVQLDVPLQVRVLHWSEVQVSAVPTHCPLLLQVSLKVQALPSSQLVPVRGVSVQLDVPLQVRVLHVSEVQVMAVPTHCPLLLQVSSNVQALASLHAAPVLGVTVQLAVPLQVRVLHVSEVHVTAVLWQTPALQESMVQAFPSLQSVTVVQDLHPSIRVLEQTPPSQDSKVQAFWSSQSAAVEQGVQPSIAE